MDSLIRKLEEATGPDRELDGRIYCAVNGLTFHSVSKDGAIHFDPDEHGTHTMVTPHPYTGSLDRAVTLIPEGREWSIERRFSKGMAGAYASIWSAGARDVDFHANADARTVELALVLAALKAIQSSKNSDTGRKQ